MTAEGVKATNLLTDEEVFVPCDWVVAAIGSEKNEFSTEGIRVPVYYAGDCSGDEPGDIANAIRTGYRAANGI